MVKVDFICEGNTEKIIVDSENFRNLLNIKKCKVGRVINAEGKGNIHKEIIKSTDADYVFIFTDLDNDNCPLITIENHIKKSKRADKKYKKNKKHIFIIAIKEIESWFLADKKAMKNLKIHFNKNPEELEEPKDKINSLLNKNRRRKILIGEEVIATKFINAGFSIENAAQNQYCTSAKHFIKKLNKINNN